MITLRIVMGMELASVNFIRRLGKQMIGSGQPTATGRETENQRVSTQLCNFRENCFNYHAQNLIVCVSKLQKELNTCFKRICMSNKEPIEEKWNPEPRNGDISQWMDLEILKPHISLFSFPGMRSLETIPKI